MIIGLGVDFVEHARVKAELARGDWQAGDGVFTPAELTYCNSTSRRERRFAACFAAKEATLKALGSEVEDLGMFREVETNLGPGFKGDILLRNRLQAKAEQLGVRRIMLSVAPGRKLVVAMVVLQS